MDNKHEMFALTCAGAAITSVDNWLKIQPTDQLILGQISGIAVDSKGNLHVFHRANRVWGSL